MAKYSFVVVVVVVVVVAVVCRLQAIPFYCVSVVPPSRHHDDIDESRRSSADRSGLACCYPTGSIRVERSVLSVEPARLARERELRASLAVETRERVGHRELDVIEAAPSDCDGPNRIGLHRRGI